MGILSLILHVLNIYPYTCHCNQIWVQFKKKLIILQNRIAKIISKTRLDGHTNPLFHSLRFIKFTNFNKYLRRKFIFRYKKGSIYLLWSFRLIEDIHCYNTRGFNVLYARQTRTKLGKFSVYIVNHKIVSVGINRETSKATFITYLKI